jgi:ferredoxin
MAVNEIVREIMVHPEKCTACYLCQLICSFSKLEVFNPSEAHIRIEFVGDDPKISFRDGCDKCGMCAVSCVYGALTLPST